MPRLWPLLVKVLVYKSGSRQGLAWCEVAFEVGRVYRRDQEADRTTWRAISDDTRDQGLIRVAGGLLTKRAPAYERRCLQAATVREDRVPAVRRWPQADGLESMLCHREPPMSRCQARDQVTLVSF